ncbi:MAG: ABC transporter permease [Planctomycetes bacterium]|nr:ABC transporter permease [Planctomycetota bacterium]
MRAYLLRRVLSMLPTLLLIFVVTFSIIRLAPGDPASMAAFGGEGGNQGMSEQMQSVLAAKKQLLGLDRPIATQFWSWMGRLVHWDASWFRADHDPAKVTGLSLGPVVFLDFDRSFEGDHEPVIRKVLGRLPVSITLALLSITLVYLISIPVGVYGAVRQNSWFDRVSTVGLFVLYSIPNFWLAMLLIVFLGGGDFLNWFPTYGLKSAGYDSLSFSGRVLDRAHHLVLPVTCLTYAAFAGLSRYARTGMLEVIRQDYIRTARAKGLAERLVIFKHALRNSLIPILTLLGGILPALIGGSIIVESIFNVPGMGRLSFEAVLSRDYPVIMGVAVISATLTLLGVLLSDFLYSLVDPRISFD